ncbi:hypothetical protein [Methylobacterium organophilum]|uniref:Uncharacterized protein n=1 Tax=Methylobacterium organophilum TaxID=410 RepID=A0ABQ4T815_METOR|nr:hypothetical protein [Methylobacterium organophilum]UMY16867.1 hypothetical protein MMB17_19770 [Methylobacterium organophilum]GJE27463.1 hypothetical protein LKMONMHP_2322 [Methylobacterium organophilum]
MSAGLFQTLPGAHEMGGAQALPSEPWLLPISDREERREETSSEALLQAVKLSSRRFWLAANALCAVLALLLTAQVATDWRSPVGQPASGQVAEATPPTIAVEKASLVHH